jgi:hypothetical protein
VKTKLLAEGAEKTFAVVFDTGDEVIAGLTRFAIEQHLHGSRLSGIGAFSRVKCGFFDLSKKSYEPIVIDEQVEVLSLIGDIALDRGKPKIHAHLVAGKADGTAWGGHLLEGYVRPTLEIIVIESPRYLQRVFDQQVGLPLIRLDK